MDHPCPTCTATSSPTRLKVETDRTYTVQRCKECRLAFAVPRPSPAELTAFYQDTYFKKDPDSLLGYVDYEGESWAAVNAHQTWDDLADWAPETRDLPHALLDVGAATGDFGARALADGWTVTACEVSDTARDRAAAKGLTTVATLTDATGPFGLITMFHVLEHLIDPIAMLVQARELIDPVGLLAIELPHWRSAGRIVRRSKWAQLRPPEHINFFTQSSLDVALRRTGWQTAHASSAYPRAAAMAQDAIRRRDAKTAAKQTVRAALGSLGVGGYLRVVARPT